eukprot:TRINITY_DN67504_c9_g2_i1.p1 TRINITY_DN67504_c9_g2~~TRINITY_DN67504_c9_g2_i1.p1  ORF type:complete len:169 (+),score=81.31 TRINITY_DN67504_c9_g2_i1:64-570(+)
MMMMMVKHPSMKMVALACAVAAALCLAEPAAAGPLHASCHVTYGFAANNCTSVQTAVVDAIKALSGDDCGSGEKCRYALTSSSDNEVKSTHTTPVKHYEDKQTWSFSPDGSGCTLKAYSTSTVWYAVLDYGTNFCNLDNIVAQTGLTHSTTTSDKVCTQYSSHNCDKY